MEMPVTFFIFFLLMMLLSNLADSSFIFGLGKCSHRLEVEQDRVWVGQIVQVTLSCARDRKQRESCGSHSAKYQLSAGWNMVTALGSSSSASLSQLFYSRLSAAASLPCYFASHSHLLGLIHDRAFLFPPSLGLRNTALKHQLCFPSCEWSSIAKLIGDKEQIFMQDLTQCLYSYLCLLIK